MDTITLGDSTLNLPVAKQRTTVIIEPTSAAGGTYDSAEITTSITINNDQPRKIEFIVPYSTEQFSASLAVISAGPLVYKKRLARIERIGGDLERVKPYLRKMGYADDAFDTPAELKAIAGKFRAGTLELPAGTIVVKIQVTAVIEPVLKDGVNLFAFKAYSPLPAFGIAGGRVPLTLTVLFKGDETIKPVITKSEVTNPFGDGLNPVGSPILGQVLCEDLAYCWKWQTDPVVDFEYHY